MSEAIANFEIWNLFLNQKHTSKKLVFILALVVSLFSVAIVTEVKNITHFNNPLTWLGSFSYGVSGITKPEILDAEVKPDKVRVGDTMTIVVKVKDTFEVKSVTADMAGIETVELKLKEGDNRQGTWEAIWRVHSVKEGEYITTIIATNILGQEAFSQILWSDPTIELLTEKTEAIWGNVSTNMDDPYNTSYEDSRAQVLYLASDLTAAGMISGTITSIQLKCYEAPGRPNLANFRIRIKLTPATIITEWEGTWADVYGPANIVPTAGAWQTYDLNSPFYWDGTSNLMIDISRDDTDYFPGGGMYRRLSAGTNRMLSGFCDSCSLYSRTGPPVGNDSAKTYVPKIQITYTPDNQAPKINQVIGPPAQVNVGDNLAFDVHWQDAGVSSGAAWTQKTAGAQWAARFQHTSLVYNYNDKDQMWVIGGAVSQTGSRFNDVWYSSDGTSWTRATAGAQWAARYAHASVVYNGKMWVMAGWIGSRLNDVWYSSDGTSWTRATAGAQWSARDKPTALVYSNQMWLIGGYLKNDVWYSTNGTTWTQKTATAQWSARFNHTSLAYNGWMWVMGGTTAQGQAGFNDVWYSGNGATWTRATAAASWNPRYVHVSVSYNGKMWVMAGFSVLSRYNDIWYSADGATWTQATAKARFAARDAATALVYGDTMWVIGGYGIGFFGQPLQDVWYAAGADQTKTHICKTDGISCPAPQTCICTVGTWRETDSWSLSSPSNCNYTTQLSDVGSQSYYAFVCDDDNACSPTELGKTNGTFTVLPPNQTPLINSVTTSPEPVSVGEKITFDVTWSDPNAGDQTKIHICKTNNISDQTWTCQDESWCETDIFSANSPTSCSSTIQMGDSGTYYAFVCDDDNSCSGSGVKNFTISSPNQTPTISSATPSPNPVAVEGEVTFNVVWEDAKTGSGVSWVTATSSGQWSARSSHTSLLYDGKMWVIGGYTDSPQSDVWFSTNGATWTQQTTGAQWGARYRHTSLVYNNKMWVIGGLANSILQNDVWFSTNGATWTQQTAGAQWPARLSSTSIVYNNKMWIIGGYLGFSYSNDVWYSANGTTWTQQTAGAQWVGRERFTSLVFNNPSNPSEQAMWVIGGSYLDVATYFQKNVWYSTNGTTWTQATAAAQWAARHSPTSLVYDNKMWVIGGDTSAGTVGDEKNDVWYSANGTTWTQQTAGAQWGTRASHTSLVYNNQMWVIGGYYYSGGTIAFNDTWYSSGDQTKTHICKTSGVPTPSPFPELACPGGSWCDTAIWSSNSPSSCSYTTQSGDVGTPRSYSAFVCDDDNACSAPSSGDFTVSTSGQPQAIMSCDSNECPGVSCDVPWTTYRPTGPPCNYKLRSENSTDPDNDISIVKWYKKLQGDTLYTQWGIDCSSLCYRTVDAIDFSVGTYDIKLYVEDIHGSSSETVHSLTVQQEVTAAFTCSEDSITWKSCDSFSNQLYEGQLIYVKDDSIPSGGGGVQITSREWKNNNNVFGTGATAFVSLLASGNTITLTVTDSAGRTDDAIQTITASYLLPEWREISPLSFLNLDKLMSSISRFWISK